MNQKILKFSSSLLNPFYLTLIGKGIDQFSSFYSTTYHYSWNNFTW